MPISASRWRATCSRACARICGSSSCRRRSTARASPQLLGDAPVIAAEGRAFPVETALSRPRSAADRAADGGRDRAAQCARTRARCWRSCPARRKSAAPRRSSKDGSSRHATSLRSTARSPATSRTAPSRPPRAGRRKIVLATSIAETSITIEGVRIVIDSGLARVPRFEPDVGVTRLETVRVSRAAADQRRGRAGRIEPGICYRLWDEPQTASLEAVFRGRKFCRRTFPVFALDLAAWGSTPEKLAFLDPPPRPALAEAKTLLVELGAIDADGRITEEGQKLRRLPLPPRLARMVVDAAADGAALDAAEIAVLIGERGLGGDDVDLTHRLDDLRRDRSPRARDARAMAARWAEEARSRKDRRQKSRRSARSSPSHTPNGSRKTAAAERARFCSSMAVARMSMPPRRWRATLFSRSPNLPAARRRAAFCWPRRSHLMRSKRVSPTASTRAMRSTFDQASASLRARRQRRFGALELCEQPMPVEANEGSARILAQGVARLGIERLPWSKALRQWRDRVMFLRTRRRRRMAGSVGRRARRRHRLACVALLRQDGADRTLGGRFCFGADRAPPLPAAAAARRRSADAFRRAHGHAGGRSTTRRKADRR